MKKLLVLLSFFFAFSCFAAAPKSEVQPLIDEWLEYYPFCKGNPDIRERRIFCRKGDAVSEELEKKGWCWQGPAKDSPSAHFDWRVCRNNTYEDNISNYITGWEIAKKNCRKHDPNATEEEREYQKYDCENQQFYENYFKRHDWCLDSQAALWTICPATGPHQRIPNLIRHWKVLTEKCPHGFEANSPYCSRLPGIEAEFRKEGYCLKRQPSQAETAVWGECR